MAWEERRIQNAAALSGAKRYLCLAGLTYGLVIHLRIYPAVFVVPLTLHFLEDKSFSWFYAVLYYGIFGVFSTISFVGLGVGFYRIYGWEFVDECYLHHGKRVDSQVS